MKQDGSGQSFDAGTLKGTFPSLADPSLHYLDSAATAQMPEVVFGAVRQFELEERANVHEGVHRLGRADGGDADYGGHSLHPLVRGFRDPGQRRPRQDGRRSCRAAGSDAAEFVKNRVAMQQEHMQTIWKEFDGSVRATVPLFETEVRARPMLQRLRDAMFAADELASAPGASVRPPQHIGASR